MPTVTSRSFARAACGQVRRWEEGLVDACDGLGLAAAAHGGEHTLVSLHRAASPSTAGLDGDVGPGQARVMASPRVRAVLEMVSEMTAEERGELRDELEGSSEEWASAWSAELERRMAQIERGEVKLLTREEFFAPSGDERR
jgi:hypothetical protein